MTESKRTPGPWEAVNIGDQGWTVVAGDTIVAIIGGGNNGEDFDPAYEADSRLIAAAPKLLEALLAFMPELDQRERFISANDSAWSQSELAMLDRIRSARAAISKAGAA